MDALVTAIAETLATAFVRLGGFDWKTTWTFPLGDDEVIVTVARLRAKTIMDAPQYTEETLLGVPV